MHDEGSRLPWTEEQWAGVQCLVQGSANRARVANSILPLVGPLPPGQASVPLLELDQSAPAADWYGSVGWQGATLERFAVDDSITTPLTTIACDVFLRSQQAADPELASAKQMLSRAAVIVGRLEDALVFEGQPARGYPPIRGGNLIVQPPIYTVRGGRRFDGLRAATLAANRVKVVDEEKDGEPQYGENLVQGVVNAVDILETRGQYGPFGCVLGHALYEAAHHPNHYMVMPRDRFVPFLGGGPLLRTSTLPPDEGLVVATADAPIDLVIATDVHVSYIQRTIEPRYVLRVSERLALRIKQRQAIAHLVPQVGCLEPDPEPQDAPDHNGGD
jgi:uncharacterized linocin/CFP29 family protein